MTTSHTDTTIRPQDDFFGYINNAWIRDNPIPPTESVWGSFYELRDQSWRAVHDIVDELRQKKTDELTPDQQTLKTFFDTALNYELYRDNHIQTIHDELDRIEAIDSPSALAHYIGHAQRFGISAFWSFYSDLDDKDSQMQVLRIQQSGLRLPNRDYYLDDTAEMTAIRQKYHDHHGRLYSLLPEIIPADWSTIFETERTIAKHSWTNVALRDVHKNYTRVTRDELMQNYAPFDWVAYFDGINWSTPNDHIVLGQPTYLRSIINFLSTAPLDTIKAYLAWQVIGNLLSWIDSATADEVFEFFGKTIAGTKEIQPLWKRSVLQADRMIIGETLGREYATRHFPESSKQSVEQLVEDIRSAYHARIDRLTWMQPATKQRAHAKLDAIKVFIGYPSVWKDLSSLKLTSDNHLANTLAIRDLDNTIELAKVGQKPADEDWFMNAHTVNAYNHPNRMEIVFPAAILQSPFYDPNVSHASNLGGIGAVIGHEFTHGFDDQGAEFDEHGNINRWQTDDEQAEFLRLAEPIVRQADAFETVPGVYLQGKLILGEAIADVGGLQLAIEALKQSSPDDLDAELEDLLVNFARAERGSARHERLVELAKTDPHPPSRFRVNCVVNHIDDFYDLYDVRPSDALYLMPENRAQIW